MGMWIPKGGNTLQASNLWRDAFYSAFCNCPVVDWNDFRATLDIQGLWLIKAAKAAGSGACHLSSLLDEMVSNRIQTISAPGITELTLAPKTPGAHMRQLRIVAEPSDFARSLTLYLGKITLELRNFIEHGIEVPTERGLLIRNEDTWQSKREYVRKGKKGGDGRGKSVTLFEWIRQTASDQNWPQQAALPSSLPPAATGLILDTDSLSRCLVLISLLIAGSQAHLRLS
jgi:hypothetical protein